MTAKLTDAACRAARGILKWTVRDLAREARLSPNTVFLIESGRPFREESAAKIVAALATHSVEITNGDGTGARLRFDFDRGELHTAFAEIVEALEEKREPPARALIMIDQIIVTPRVGADILPAKLGRSIRDMTEEEDRVPGTYAEAAPMLRRLL